MTDGPDWTYTDLDGDQLQVTLLEDLGSRYPGPVVGVTLTQDTVYVRPQDIPAVAQALYRSAGLPWPGERVEDATGPGDRLGALEKQAADTRARVRDLETRHRNLVRSLGL